MTSRHDRSERVADAPRRDALAQEDLGELGLAFGRGLERRREGDPGPPGRVELGERQPASLERCLPRLDGDPSDLIGRDRVTMERQAPTLAWLGRRRRCHVGASAIAVRRFWWGVHVC